MPSCCRRIENGADGVHRLDHAVRRFLWQIAETLGYLRAGTLGEFLEQRLSRGSHADDLAAAVGGVGFRGDQAIGPETLEDAAEIGCVEMKIALECSRRDAVVRCDLEKDARLCQRIGAVQIGSVQDTEEIRIEAAEFAHRFDGGQG